jgi:hypothetical protein
MKDDIKRSKIYLMEVLERGNGERQYLKNYRTNFPELLKNIDPHIQKFQ